MNKKQEYMYTLSSGSMTGLSLQSFDDFLSKANNAHTIDIKMRADGREYTFQADFLKYIKKLPVERNDVTGHLEEVGGKQMAQTFAYHKKRSEKLDDVLQEVHEKITHYQGMVISAQIYVKKLIELGYGTLTELRSLLKILEGEFLNNQYMHYPSFLEVKFNSENSLSLEQQEEYKKTMAEKLRVFNEDQFKAQEFDCGNKPIHKALPSFDFKAPRGLTPSELNKIIQSRIDFFDEAIELLSKAETDYRGLAVSASNNGLKATAKDALETADHLHSFLKKVKSND